MLMLFKTLAMVLSWFATVAIAILFAACLCFWQVEGMFWYGIMLIISGLCLDATVTWFMKE